MHNVELRPLFNVEPRSVLDVETQYVLNAKRSGVKCSAYAGR